MSAFCDRYRKSQEEQRRLQLGLVAVQMKQLYRITNELINNIIKHAQATEGQVSLCQTRSGWQLIVSDNGRGFDLTRSKPDGGIGLKNLYARAQTLNATVHIESGEGGTRVTVTG